MRHTRLYVEQPLAEREQVRLPASAAHHAIRVLRLGNGSPITLFNGDGCNYAAALAISGQQASAHIRSSTVAAVESPLDLTLVQCLAKGDKMDFVIQKAVELGVGRIVPLTSERSSVRLDERRAARRLERWRAIIIGACEQSGRARIPVLENPRPLGGWAEELSDKPSSQVRRLALFPDAQQRLCAQPEPISAVTLLIGPEGGLSTTDLKQLERARFIPVTLGPRVLRTETAGLAALAAVQACYGDF